MERGRMERDRIISRLASGLRVSEEHQTFSRYTRFASSDVLEDIVQSYVEWAMGKQGWRYEVFEGVFRLGRRLASQYPLSPQKVEVLFNDVLSHYGGIVGFFISGFLRNMEDFSIRLKAHPASGIGFRMRGGKLYVEGRTTYLGMEMEDGEIITPSTGNYLGRGMKGGKIFVKEAGDWVGMEMKGGKIVVEKAGNALGFGMEGGEIIAREAGEWVGESSKGGRIEVERYLSLGEGRAKIAAVNNPSLLDLEFNSS